jgi:hypothetical protein
MTNQLKYCRYKGYKLQVLNIHNNVANTVTGDYETGKNLNMECQDRDRFVLEYTR